MENKTPLQQLEQWAIETYSPKVLHELTILDGIVGKIHELYPAEREMVMVSFVSESLFMDSKSFFEKSFPTHPTNETK